MVTKKQKKTYIFGGIALLTFVAALVLITIGYSHTMSEIKDNVISKTPDAVLASAGVIDKSEVSLPVMYYDQRADECVNMYDEGLRHALYARQFEWSECGYYNKGIEQGLVEYELNDELLPVGVAGSSTSNRGLGDLTRWFDEVDGKSQSYAGILKMSYQSDGAVFQFIKDEFYPLDEAEFSKGDYVNEDGHNHLFTMSFAAPFKALLSGEESFEITADDDTFVFVGNKLVVDMGGIHGATTGRFEIHENGEIYVAVEAEEMAFSGVKLNKNDDSIVRIFHADRDSADSTLKVKFTEMNLVTENVQVAEGSMDMGLQVAYDPSNPSYVAPLGRSLVVKPDDTKGNIVLATIEGTLIVVFAVLLMFAIRFVVKNKIFR